MTNAVGIGYNHLGTLPDEEAVDLLEEFGQVPDHVEAMYIARFRAMSAPLWERAYRVFMRRSSVVANTTASPQQYRDRI